MQTRRLRFSILLVIFLFSITAFAQDESPVTFTELTTANLPWDAVPSPEGDMIYFTAISEEGSPGVFAVPSAGGDVMTLAAQPPFVMPLGVAVSTDGETLYVSDPWSTGSDGNAVFALTADSGAAVEGTQGTAPTGIEIINQNDVDMLYFTGIDPTDGQPAVYRVEAVGGEPEMLAKGAPLVAPSGITITKDGTVYVLDRLASGNGLGGVVRIQDSTAELMVSDVRTGGQLAGLTLTLDEALLLVSSLDNEAGTAQVLVVDLATGESSIVNNVIGENTSAGGLHRAHRVNQFAWADSTSGPRSGRVFGVGMP